MSNQGQNLKNKEIKKPTRIFVVGDSISYGSDDFQMGGWVNRLKISIRREWGKFNQVYNLSIPGRNTNDFLDWIEPEIKIRLSSSPRKYILLIALSVNDAAYLKSINKYQLPLEEYEGVLNKLVVKTNNIVDKIIFISPIKVDDTRTNPWNRWNSDYYLKNNQIKKYNSIAKKFCETNNYHYIDILDLLEESHFDDGLHPNSEGHEKIFKKIKSFLLKEYNVE